MYPDLKHYTGKNRQPLADKLLASLLLIVSLVLIVQMATLLQQSSESEHHLVDSNEMAIGCYQPDMLDEIHLMHRLSTKNEPTLDTRAGTLAGALLPAKPYACAAAIISML